MEIIRFPNLRLMLGTISRSTIDRWEKAGCFPKRIHLGKNSVGWNLDDIKKWLSEKHCLNIDI